MIMTILDGLDSFLYYPVLIIVLLAAGLYFSVRTGFVQFRLFGESIRVVAEKPAKDGSVSSFQALMVSTASRVGTGNIIGVSTAICLGGFGAAFWMWVIALIGGASAFVESTLAQVYKRKDPNGDSYGGPAYYIESALHNRGLGVAFAVSLILTYAGGFNMLASYNLQDTFKAYSFYTPGVTPWIIGAILAVLVGWCIMGGGKRVVKATSTLVPIMGVLYVAVSLVVILFHINLVPGVFAEIFRNAFDFQAIFGGVAGSCMMYGIKRGLYSNEAGVGSAPNAAAAADVSHPVKQGLVQMLSVFIDTLLICTATALMCMCSGVTPTADIAGAQYVQQSVSSVLGGFGPIFITIAMVLFAFTTLLGNLYYCDNCLAFILKKTPSKQFMTGFRIIAALVIFVGAGLSMAAAWDIADILMAVMCFINLPACIVLSKVAIDACKDYEKQKSEGKNPVFHARDIGLEDAGLDYWQ
ncbi:alanine/glycine:cation symporter family protein [Dysosmobacter sp. HCP28S3_G4]|uniref:alanine/glycine:cation symporter family protein n=1 Tax=Dysosmobacter sp. HCP28S3_G4 TaxID=3438938 RepID=UPI003F8A153D